VISRDTGRREKGRAGMQLENREFKADGQRGGSFEENGA